MGNVSLYNFANHQSPEWLDNVHDIAKDEYWGLDKKVLELYLRANFEIAKQQKAVYEDNDKKIAFWRAGCLVSQTSDPLWMVYELGKGKWKFKHVLTGEPPIRDVPAENFQIKYSPPEFNEQWGIYFSPQTLKHMFKDVENKQRLSKVFGTLANNEHLLFRTIYGEIELQRKAGEVLSQWYRQEYQFLMPLFLTQDEKVELTAGLTANHLLKRYEIKTLLLPHYSYAYARAITKSRRDLPDWMKLPKAELDANYVEADEDLE